MEESETRRVPPFDLSPLLKERLDYGPIHPAPTAQSQRPFSARQWVAIGRLGRGDWRWAFSNFADYTVRGILAEFLVGTALGCDMTVPRDPWAGYDLLTPEGVRISGRVQSWDHRGSGTKLSGLMGQTTVAGLN